MEDLRQALRTQTGVLNGPALAKQDLRAKSVLNRWRAREYANEIRRDGNVRVSESQNNLCQDQDSEAAAYLEGLFSEVDVLDVEETLAQGRYPAVPHDGGTRAGQIVGQVSQRAGSQQHDVWVVVSLEQADLQPHI
jgi:hypothetical protein